MQLLAEPIEAAPQSLQDRISYLEGIIVQLKEENAAMAATQAHLIDNQEIQLRLIHELKEKAKRSPGKTELSRAEKIERYLAARPDHKATYETLKGHLGIDNDLLGIAIKSLLPSGKYAIIKTPGDKRKRTLVMLPR
jgi:TolA-binding protein